MYGKCDKCGNQNILRADGICENCYNDLSQQWKNISKPPLGIEPHNIWVKQRRHNILEAMNRYVQADMKIPIEWVKEYNLLLKDDFNNGL